MKHQPEHIEAVVARHVKNLTDSIKQDAGHASALANTNLSYICGTDELASRIERVRRENPRSQYDIGNTSGSGEYASVPEDLDKWNWGAFLSPVLWAFRFRCYNGLLCLIPIFRIYYMFCFARHANEYAWRNNAWNDIAEFKYWQKRWLWYGISLNMLVLILNALYWGMLIHSARVDETIVNVVREYVSEVYQDIDSESLVVFSHGKAQYLPESYLVDKSIYEDAKYSASAYFSFPESDTQYSLTICIDQEFQIICAFDSSITSDGLYDYTMISENDPALESILEENGLFCNITPEIGVMENGMSYLSGLRCGYIVEPSDEEQWKLYTISAVYNEAENWSAFLQCHLWKLDLTR